MTDGGSGSGSVLASAVGHALRDADAASLRSYAVVGPLVAVLVGLLVVLASPRWVAAAAGGGPIQRVAVGFLVLVGLGVVVAAMLPLVLVERRRRTDRPQRQRAFGLAGWAYLGSLYLALLATAPPRFQSEPGGVFAPLSPAVEAVYALPPVAGAAFPIAAVAAVALVELAPLRD